MESYYGYDLRDKAMHELFRETSIIGYTDYPENYCITSSAMGSRGLLISYNQRS